MQEAPQEKSPAAKNFQKNGPVKCKKVDVQFVKLSFLKKIPVTSVIIFICWVTHGQSIMFLVIVICNLVCKEFTLIYEYNNFSRDRTPITTTI